MTTRISTGKAKKAAGVLAVAAAGMWAALHLFPGFGPAVADGVRKVAGPAPVAWAEDVVYGVEDRLKSLVYRGAPPKKLWSEPAPVTEERAPAQAKVASLAPAPVQAGPAVFAPPFAEVAASGDGTWLPIADSGAPDQPARMWKTSVHPDARRGYAVVALVAMDLSRLALHMVPGTVEPATDAEIPARARPGIVPGAALGELVAAFNGGFKAEHGHYGMMVDGRTFLPARASSCTVAIYKDGSVRVAGWPALREGEADMAGYRQTPPCLVEDGQINEKLAVKDDAAGWGVAVGTTTAIRRSALGLDKARKTLFYAIGDSVTAGTLARAMKAAGADEAAQLDVNASFPRFLTYAKKSPDSAPRVASSLVSDSPYVKAEYVGFHEERDFFYVTRRAE